MNDKSKKLKRMATWTVATFATIFAIVMTILWLPLFNSGNSALEALGAAFVAGWAIIVIALLLCVGVYLGYYIYLKNQK